MQEIDNLSLLEPGHEFRFKEKTYGIDFIVVPYYVYHALS